MDPIQRIISLAVKTFGTRLSGNPLRCESVFRDYTGNDHPRVVLLIAALHEGIIGELEAGPGRTSETIFLGRLQYKLVSNRGLSEGNAKWAVETWREALRGATLDGAAFSVRCPDCKVPSNWQGKDLGQVVACPGCATRIRISSAGNAAFIELASAAEEAEANRPHTVVDIQGTAPFKSIPAALQAMPPGAQITVKSGTYTEPLTMTKDVELIGDSEAGPVVMKVLDRGCVQIQSGTVRMRNMQFNGESSPYRLAHSTIRIQSGRLELEDCVVHAAQGDALEIAGNQTQAIIAHSSFSAPKRSAINIRGQAEVQVDDSSISVTGTSAIVGVSSKISILGSTIEKAKFTGVNVTGGTLTLTACTIAHHADTGVMVKNAQLFVTRCAINNNIGRGVMVSQSSSGELKDNDLTNNKRGGLHVDASCTVKVSGNRGE